MKGKREGRSVRLQAMVTPEEAKYIKQLAKDNGVGVSDLIREVMLPFDQEIHD